ncbi:hypothetical protein Bca4012_095519 [Brassica carinata]
MEAILARLEKLESLRRKDQRAVAKLLEKLQDEEEEVETAENQSSKDALVLFEAEKETPGDTAAEDEEDNVVTPLSLRRKDQRAVANLLEKLQDEEEEVETAENQSSKDALVLFEAEKETPGDTAAEDDEDDVVTPLSLRRKDQRAVANLLEKLQDEEEEVETAENQSSKDALVLFEVEKETPGDTAAEDDEDDVVTPLVRRQIKRPLLNVVTDTAEKVIFTASSGI